MNKISKLLLSFFLVFTSFNHTPVLAEEVKETELTEEEQELVENLVIDEQGFIHVESEEVQKNIKEAEQAETILDETLADGLDFNSKRLLVAGDETLLEGMNVISEYNGLYLVQFETVEDAKLAYLTLIDTAAFVEPDVEVVATEEEPEIVSLDEPELTEEENPFVELENELAKEEVFEEIVDKKQIVVALLDTGVNENEHVVGRVSMLGDNTDDDNGHGNRMLEYMVEENPEIKVLSVKVLDANGKGNISSVVAGMEYAIEQGVDIINLSLSARSTLENSVLKEAVDKAVSLGIKVVGSAGNGGFNVKYTVPGNVESAIIVAAFDEEGKYQPGSNFGETVDYGFIGAESTSEATARFSALLALENDEEKVYADSRVIKPDEKHDDIDDRNNNEFVITDTVPFPTDMTCASVDSFITTWSAYAARAESLGEWAGHTAYEWRGAVSQAENWKAANCSAPQPTCSFNGVSTTGAYLANINTGFFAQRFTGFGKTLFCMDPFTLFNSCSEATGYYQAGTGSLTEAQAIQLAKILGAFLKTDQSDAHYLATQIMIWNTISSGIAVSQFRTVSAESYNTAYANIQNIINGMTTDNNTIYAVDLSRKSINLSIGYGAVDITDNNSNLRNKSNKFTIENKNPGSLNVTRIDNGFKIKVTDPYPLTKKVVVNGAASEIKDKQEEYSFEAYYAQATQRMASFGTFLSKVSALSYEGDELVVTTPVGKLEITKKEEGTNRTVTTPTFITEDNESITNVKVVLDLWMDPDSHYVGTSADNKETYNYNGKTMHQFKDVNGKTTWEVDSNGKVLIENIPIGKYYIRERSVTSNGDYFEKSMEMVEVTVTNGETAKKDFINQSTVKMKLIKTDKDTKTTKQGDTSIEGAEFTIYDTSAGNKVMGKLTVKADGTTNVVDKLPRSHNYKLVETVVPPGYTKVSDITITSAQLKAGVNTERIYTANVSNSIARLTLKVQKRDNLTGSNKPMGAGTFEGAVFEVYNKSANDITYKGNRIKVGDLVDTVTTDKDGVATVETLPYGTYLVKEIKAPKGYLLEGNLETTVILHGEDGSAVFANEYRGRNGKDSTNKSIDNDPIRGDFELRKISSEPQGRMSNIQFKVTSRTTGESVIFMTDENGEFRSIATWNSHKENTNKGETELDGIWFGKYIDDEGKEQWLEPDDEWGALPYDTYDIEELQGPNNEGYTMWKDSFVVNRPKTIVQLNSVENTKIEIGTKASSINNDKIVPAVEDTIVIDTVTVKGAKNLIGEKAMLVGTLMDKETGEPLEVDGATARVIFDVKKADFEKDIEFTVNGIELQGKNIVVYEKLYKVTVDKDGNVLTEEEVGKHEDINDEDQLVTVPEAKTTLKDQKTDTHVIEYREDVTLVDTVIYKGLKKGRTYEVEGILMDKATGKPFLDKDGKQVTATTKYKATASDGEVELEFTFKGIKKGMKIVAFETVYYKGEEYIVHADLNDEDQTVYVPEIKTRAEGVNETQFIVEGPDATIVDTIDYKAFVPGETYVLKGTLYDKTEGKLTDITAESEPFVAETSDGSVEVTFNFDATGLGNHIMVVYEKAFMLEKPENPDDEPVVPDTPIATHEDPEDKDQTIEVEVPEDEKYVNKVVHEELGSFKDTFTYDIMGYVTHDADAIEFTDELVEELTFASDEVKVSVHEDNDHKPNGTVASEGKTLELMTYELDEETQEEVAKGDYTFTIEGQKLTVEISDAKELRGQWVKVTFDAKIKDEYKSLEALKQRTVENNGNVLTEEVHTGVPNEAEMIIKVGNEGKYKIKTNPPTVIPPTPEIKTTLVAENLKTVYRGQVYEMTDTVEYKNLEVGETYRMEGYLVNDKGEKLDVEPVSVEFTPEARNGSVELTFTVDTAIVKDEHIVAFETLYVLGDVDKDTEPTDDNPTPKKDTPVAEHKDPKDPSQTVTVIEPDEPFVEKYINKAVHKDVTLDEVFTYDIIAFVPQNADEIELTDELNSDLQFVSKASDITLVDLGMDDNHMVENNIYNEKVNDNATVSLEGTKVDAEVMIEGQNLTITANAENLRGHYVKATFDAKIKDGMKVEDLKYTDITENNPVITDESHNGVPNVAELRVRVRNDWSSKYKSNTVTVKTVKIGTIAKFDNGKKTIKAGESNKVIDTIKYSGLTPGKKYVAYAQMMDKSGKGVSLKTRFEFTVLSSEGEVAVPIPFGTDKLKGKYVAFEEVYELSTKDGKEVEKFVAEHKDLNDEDQTVTVETPDIPTSSSLPYIAIGVGLVALIGLVFFFFKKKKA